MGLIVLIVLFDQLSKHWISLHLSVSQLISVLPGVNLVLVHNPGAAFGFLSDAGPWQRWFFIVLSLVIIAVLCRWWMALPAAAAACPRYGLSLILGGAFGNLCDRIWRGQVVDFIDVYYRHWHWPAFNVADSAITIGAVLLCIDILRPAHSEATT